MSSIGEAVKALTGALNNVEEHELDDADIRALADLNARTGFLLHSRADSNSRRELAQRAQEARNGPEPESRNKAQSVVRQALYGRPWKAKTERNRDGGFVIVNKSYTDLGTVVTYTGTVADTMALADRIDEALEPIRSRTITEVALGKSA